MAVSRHPKKEIQAAIEYAVEKGWTFEAACGRILVPCQATSHRMSPCHELF